MVRPSPKKPETKKKPRLTGGQRRAMDKERRRKEETLTQKRFIGAEGLVTKRSTQQGAVAINRDEIIVLNSDAEENVQPSTSQGPAAEFDDQAHVEAKEVIPGLEQGCHQAT
jgi:hypothetical protein